MVTNMNKLWVKDDTKIIDEEEKVSIPICPDCGQPLIKILDEFGIESWQCKTCISNKTILEED